MLVTIDSREFKPGGASAATIASLHYFRHAPSTCGVNRINRDLLLAKMNDKSPELSGSSNQASTETNLASSERLRRVIWIGLLLATAYVSWFWYDQLYCAPVDFYHRVWKLARDNVYNPEKLKNWDVWEHKFDSQIKNDEDSVKYANEMLASLKDPYTNVSDAIQVQRAAEQGDGLFVGIGMIGDPEVMKECEKIRALRKAGDAAAKAKKIFQKVIKVWPDSPAERAGLHKGDKIVSLNGIPLEGESMQKTSGLIRKNLNKEVELVVERGDKLLALKVTPSTIALKPLAVAEIDPEIGYLRINTFIQKDVPERVEQELTKLGGKKGLILDLRGNGGGSVDSCLKVASLFLETGRLTSIKARVSQKGYVTYNYDLKSQYIQTDTCDGDRVLYSDEKPRFERLWKDKPMVVLFDEHSASAAEMLAGALVENDRALSVGEKSYGKGVAQQTMRLPNGARMSVTTGRYYTPKGKWLGDGTDSDKHGLVPDNEVAMNDEVDYQSPSDTQLSAAVELLKERMGAEK